MGEDRRPHRVAGGLRIVRLAAGFGLRLTLLLSRARISVEPLVRQARAARELLALANRLVLEVVGAAHDVGRQEHQQVDLRERALGRLEEPAQDRDIAQPRHLGDGVAVVVAEHPADHDRLAVGHHHRVLDATVGERDADGLRVAGDRDQRLVDVGDLLEDLEAKRVALGDLGRHPQRHADVLALDVHPRKFLEARTRIHFARPQRARGTRERGETQEGQATSGARVDRTHPGRDRVSG